MQQPTPRSALTVPVGKMAGRSTASSNDLAAVANAAIPRPFEPITLPNALDVYESYTFGEPTGNTQGEIQQLYEQALIDNLTKAQEDRQGFHLFHLGDVLPTVAEGVQCLVQDSFTKCFEGRAIESWNWNIYLFPMWVFGLFIRLCILFPLRLLVLLVAALIISSSFVASSFMSDKKKRMSFQMTLIRWLATAFVMSWSGVIKYHGVPPSRKANQIFVSNHTSLIDIIVLMQWQCFAAVGQKHVGFVGFLQDYLLRSLGCLWFERNEQKERLLVAKRIREHISDVSRPPLLIFPEGTCVNNEYAVMFKKGAFEIGADVHPVAIKYNKIFANCHWNSKRESFLWHLLRLMTSWAVVCDVWFLEPQTQRADESAAQFASRVKELICRKARLTPVPWDGYLKHVRPTEKFLQLRQKYFANSLALRGSSTNLAAMVEEDASSGGGIGLVERRLSAGSRTASPPAELRGASPRSSPPPAAVRAKAE